MRWLADECVHSIVVVELRKAGHDVTYAAEVARQAPDLSLVDQAFMAGEILLTEDKDFGEIVFHDAQRTQGIVLLRIAPSRWKLKWPRLREAIEAYGDSLYTRYTVIDEGRIRSHLLV